MKIYIREYYSDSPAVRREIRRYRDQTIARLRAYYRRVREATGLPLDVDAIATLLAVKNFAVFNYYLEFPRTKRKAMRERMAANVMQLIVDGVLAVRTLDEEPAD